MNRNSPTPGDRRTRGEPRAELAPDMPVERAVRTALAPELASWLAEEEGLLDDRDPECLHRGRVALRRARSVLRELGPAPPARGGTALARELRWLGKVSGPQRDLDVFLEGFDGWLRELPPDLRPGLRQLRSAAREQRERARRRLLEALQGERYRALLHAWRTFLEPPAPLDGVENGPPILPLVARRLRKRHGRLVELGERLSARSSADAFHELRIECKKLRYLLDAFRGLFAPARASAATAALKRFQSALGDANDAHFQAARIQALAEQLHAARAARASDLLAAGSTLVLLAARAKRARAEFLRRFRAYARGEERDLVAALLASPEGPNHRTREVSG